ncbi:MAG: hypothetical protein H0T46_05200 [Deltaproteobacteria bacterium]|nr:hypothetical protein [Deltaproteobacteria bacterium]
MTRDTMGAMKPNVVLMVVLVGALVESAAAAPDPRIASCRQEQKLRKQSACLSKIVDAAATQAVIDAQLEIARKALVARPEQSISGREDFEYAAENAGIAAAKTSIDRLTAHVVKGDATAQRFGLRGLAHALSLLRMGYANGGERDRQMRADLLGPIGGTCRERLESPEELVITEAFRCVGETRDRQHAAAMVKAIAKVADRGKLARAGVLALRDLEGLDVATVKPLIRILENPLPAAASSDDIWVRADVCRLFSSVVAGSERWAQLPAKTAAERIGKSNSQAREACEQLGAKLGRAAPPASSSKNWFPSQRFESCRPDRLGILGDAEVCVFSEPAGPSTRKYRLAIEDVSKLDPSDNTRHAAIVSTDLRVGAGEYIHVEAVAAFELSDGRWLIIVPVVAGNPDSYTAKHAQLHVLDTATKKLVLAQTTTPCRGASCQQDVQLSRKKGVETPVDILVGGDAKQKLVWDGKALRPSR